MEGLKVAGRYAQSLLELSEERKVTDEVLKDMKTLLVTTNENRDFHLFVNSPLIKADKKTAVFDKLFGDFQELSKRFVHLLVKNHREMYLPLIAKEYIDKVNEQRNIIPITLTSAKKLEENTKKTILEKLNKKTQGEIELTEETDESLIGGFVARMGDTRIDASISHQLNVMKKRLVK